MSQEQTPDVGAFAEHTPLVELLDGSARVRILSVLVDERTRPLSISELARQAGVARSTVYDHLSPLEDLDVVETVGDGNAKYQLRDDELGELLYKLDGVVMQRRQNDTE